MGHWMLSIAFFHDRPPLPWQQNLGQISYNSVCVRDICEIFASIGGFSEMGHWMQPIAFSHDRPPLPWQQNLGQINYNSVCVRDICEIFASIGGLRGWGIECCQTNFTPTDSLQWERNLGKKVILFSSTLTHGQCDVGNMTFCDFCCFRCASFYCCR